ncbi:MAG: adenylate/guanylate cyclase domain-containing protein [Thermoplasmata archaeon]|nr:adenylate/guanylate cyclase domain-containing protein [Thermoplasmata archaeon]
MIPETRYARSDGVHIAYQVFGRGPPDLVFVPGWVSHIEYAWEEPMFARFMERLASFARVLWFDKRGTGLSDRVAGLPILEQRTDDLRAVMEAAGSKRAAIFGTSEGGSMSALFAATYPKQVQSLILYGAFAKRVRAPGYPWAPTRAARVQWIRQLEAGWGGAVELDTLAPSVAHDPAFQRWFAAYGRLSASPSAAVALARMNTDIDIRTLLPSIHVPTLVLHRRGDRDVRVENGRYLAEHIPGAKWVELPGEDHVWWVGDTDAILDEVEEFVTGTRAHGGAERVLTTILFTDIVGSTPRAKRLGDRSWTDLLSRHHRAVRAQLARFGGREVKSTGDGFLATFDGPARGIRCAVAIGRAVGELGLSVRRGLHTGECEVMGDDLGGVGVHLAARVAGESDGGNVVVTSTVKELVVGSGIEFRDLGRHRLKGVSEPWRLFEVREATPGEAGGPTEPWRPSARRGTVGADSTRRSQGSRASRHR